MIVKSFFQVAVGHTLCRVLMTLLLVPCALASEDERARDLLVRNVMLIDPTGQVEDRRVNILMRAGLLEVVSADKIARSEAQWVLDAEDGYVLGKLEVGEAPNFMVLSKDPRENFEVLLDTREFAVFAIHNGTVVRNRLIEVDWHDEEHEPRTGGWLAYTPPPMAVPMNYRDTSKWNRFESRWISGIVTAAAALDRTSWLTQNETSLSQFGDLGRLDGGEVRALRFGLYGTLNFKRPWVYALTGATNSFDKGFETGNSDSFTLYDWRLDIPFLRHSVMSIGKQKEPISMERLMGLVFLPLTERSMVADSLLPARNVGIVWSGHHPQRSSSWAFGVFNNWLGQETSFSEGATTWSGRVTWAPFSSPDESNILHLGLAMRHTNGNRGFRYGSEPEFNKAVNFVDTNFGGLGTLAADDSSTLTLELSWRKGPFWLASEDFRTTRDREGFGDPRFDGYFVQGSWILTGEMRGYNKKNGLFGTVPVARSVYQGGMGAVEVAARYSTVDLDDGAVSGGQSDVASVGVNWWLTPFFALSANYRYIWNELGGSKGTTSAVMTRMLLMLD